MRAAATKIRGGGRATSGASLKNPQLWRRRDPVRSPARRFVRAAGTSREIDFYQIAELSSDGIFVAADRRFVYLNPAAVRLFGATSPAQLMGHSVMERFASRERMLHAARGGMNPAALADIYLRLDGSPVEVEVSAVPFRHRGGRASLVFLREVGARNRAERELVDAQSMLQSVLDHLPQPVYWKDRESRFLGANRTFLADLGIGSREDIVGKAAVEFCRDADGELYSRHDRQVMEEDVPRLDCEEYVASPRPRWLLMNTLPLHDAKGRVIGTLGTYSDISDHKAVELQLQQALHERNAMVNSAQVGIALVRDRRFVWGNPALERMLGYSLQEVKGKSVALIYAEAAASQRVCGEVSVRLAAGEVFETEIELRRSNGETFWAHMRGSAVGGSAEDGSIWILHDIDARKRAIEELQNLNAVLAKRVEDETAKALQNEHLMIGQARHAAMGEMVGNIAHQWRQPLSTLGLLVQNLRYDFAEGSLDAGQLDDYVAKALRAIDQMSNTIDDFRDFFKPDRRPEAYSPLKAIEGCLDLIGASLKANNIVLTVNGPRPFKLFGYPGEFSQILLNLISNAKDAFVERRIATGRIDIAVATADDEVIVTVRDNAGGIGEEHLVKIFDPYFTTKDKGTGIGLYMARTIVEQHMRGTIRAENTGDGAMFILTLPRSVAPAAAAR